VRGWGASGLEGFVAGGLESTTVKKMVPTDQKVSGLNPDGVTDNQQVRSLRRPFFFLPLPTGLPKMDLLVPSWVKVKLRRSNEKAPPIWRGFHN
jgi:hypothetical protein